MPDRFAETRRQPQVMPVVGTRRLAAIATGTILTGILLGACSIGSDTSFSLFIEPGKYQYYSCVQIAGNIKAWTQKRKDFKALMDRADQGAGGTAVGFIAYRGDYVGAGEELEALQSAAREKKCEQDETWRSSTVIR
jgi:hypothetical protein